MTERDQVNSNDEKPFSPAIAPIAASIVLILGVALLLFRGSGDDIATIDTSGGQERPQTTGDKDDEPDPTIATTAATTAAPVTTVTIDAPRPTPPPLFEPTTVPINAPTTVSTSVAPETDTTTPVPPKTTVPTVTTPDTGGDIPTAAELRGALVTLNDLGNDDWQAEIVPDDDEFCGDNDVRESAIHNEVVLFQRFEFAPVSVRQISQRLLTFPDAATAERAFDRDLERIEACDGLTINLDGVDYVANVTTSPFSDEDAASFPCRDDTMFTIIQLTNESADVPFLGEAFGEFRCGANITITSFASTLSVDDLTDPDFLQASGLANIRASQLTGS